MPDIRMIKYHTLPMAKARALVQKAADNLAAEYDLSSKWVGNTLHFRRSGVEGAMRVSESEIDLEVTLGFLLKAFKSKFVEHIEHNFDTLLDKAHAEHRSIPGADARRASTAAAKKSPAKASKKSSRKA
ncbi:MAG TPA: polyhydroxyalkanoic acid system family protein [Burkholderiaceae bacterium]|nr:polyhydroxyalkanoic acid system family protein [Burkholderiaceae bacterium]